MYKGSNKKYSKCSGCGTKTYECDCVRCLIEDIPHTLSPTVIRTMPETLEDGFWPDTVDMDSVNEVINMSRIILNLQWPFRKMLAGPFRGKNNFNFTSMTKNRRNVEKKKIEEMAQAGAKNTEEYWWA